jgi:MFS family permease
MPVDRRGQGFRAKLWEGWRLSREDRVYKRLILCRLAMAATALATPFYVVYSLHVLGVEAKRLSIFVGAGWVTLLALNPLWARISDGRGNSRVLRAAHALAVAPPLLALLLPLLPSGAVGPAAWGVTPRWIGAVALHVIACAAMCGMELGGTNYLLEIAPPARRPIYMAVANTYVAPIAFLAPLLGGWLADAFGAGCQVNFALAACFAATAAVAAVGLHEPRRQSVCEAVPAE